MTVRKSMEKYKVGQLVVNRKLGLGKVLEVTGDLVTVFFKDQQENPRTINVAIVPMAIAEQQTDACLDDPAKMAKQVKKLPLRKKRAKRILADAPNP